MTQERRDRLVEALVEKTPKLGKIVTDMPSSMLTGNWDLVAYCYQQSFEALWDHAARQTSGLAVLPLMMLWRQSVELTIKAAIQETTCARPAGHHRLDDLFEDLIEARRRIGCLEADDDDYTKTVRRTIGEFQKVDKRADRFRYPTAKDDRAYVGIDVDLDRLFQAHWIITGWCDGASLEAEQYNLHVRVPTVQPGL